MELHRLFQIHCLDARRGWHSARSHLLSALDLADFFRTGLEKVFCVMYSSRISLFFFLLICHAWSGPPFITDDPEPVEYHHWEFYLASLITSNSGVTGTAPHVEINFGAFHETQLHLIIPMTFNHPKNGSFTYGLGDIELGLKYRFINETSLLPQVGTFPLIEIPTGNAIRNLGAGNVQFFFPIWLQKSWGPWTTYGGGGYLVNIATNQANSWFVGWEGQRDLSKFITIGAEVFSTIFPSSSSDNGADFNVGAIINFSDNHHFLFSSGRAIVGHSDLLLYAAYQLTI